MSPQRAFLNLLFNREVTAKAGSAIDLPIVGSPLLPLLNRALGAMPLALTQHPRVAFAPTLAVCEDATIGHGKF